MATIFILYKIKCCLTDAFVFMFAKSHNILFLFYIKQIVLLTRLYLCKRMCLQNPTISTAETLNIML